MLYIFHGDDFVSARNKLLDVASNYPRVITLDADKLTISDLSQNLHVSDLFMDKKCVVIEKVGKLPKKELEYLENIVKVQKNLPDIIFYNSTELSKTFLSKFTQAKVETYLFPKLFFTFLDSLTPKNFFRELELLLKMENVESEQVFYAMIKRVRVLLAIKTNSEIEEVSKMSPWQKDKVNSQARQWSEAELTLFYKKLLGIEKMIKSSQLPFSLKQQLDFLLSSELH